MARAHASLRGLQTPDCPIHVALGALKKASDAKLRWERHRSRYTEEVKLGGAGIDSDAHHERLGEIAARADNARKHYEGCRTVLALAVVDLVEHLKEV